MLNLVPDRFIWKWSRLGEFSSASAYYALFRGWSPLLGAKQIWKVQALGKCCFFGWLVRNGRCWTSNRLRRHGLSDRDDCSLCAQEVEMLDHLLSSCVHSRKTWFCVLGYVGLGGLTPHMESPLAAWWLQARKSVAKIRQKGFVSVVWLVAWSLWKERNRGVHEHSALQLVALAPLILEEARLWAQASFVGLRHVLNPRLL